jgi:hypothetical protein
MMADKGCAERGCPMHEIGDEFIEMIPKKEWVSLTEEDLNKVCSLWEIVYGGWVKKFAKDIEEILREKNT